MPARAAVAVEADTSRLSLPASGLVLSSQQVTTELAARAAALCVASEGTARADVFVRANAPSARAACETRKVRLVSRNLGLPDAAATAPRGGETAAWGLPALAPWRLATPLPPSPRDAAGAASTTDEALGGTAPAARTLITLSLPKGSLAVAAMPALAPPPAAASGTAAAPTPLPPAAWFFGSAASLLLLKRGGARSRTARMA